MSAVQFVASKSDVQSGTALKTIVQIVAAANHRVAIEQFSFAFRGTSNTAEPVLCQVVRQTTAGTMTALTPIKRNGDDDETLAVTAQHTATAEPTTTDVLWEDYVHPQTGITIQKPFGKPIIATGAERIGFIVTAAADVKTTVTVEGEE